MTSFFAGHYALAIGIAVLAVVFVILGGIIALIASSDRLLR